MKTFVYSTHTYEKIYLEEAQNNLVKLTLSSKSLNMATVNLCKGYTAISIFTTDLVTAPILEQLHENGVRFIALRSVGYDHVSLEKASELNIKVANVPHYSPNAIAEHAVLLILSLVRKLKIGQQLMGQNDFRLDQLIGFDLKGKTIGIIGTGLIGSTFAAILHGFGCKILAYDIQENQKLKEETGISYTSLENICEKSDVISIHCPLNNATQHLFNAHLFEQMKNNVIIINTARGGIINTKDLLDALKTGKIGAAGLDVYEHEKAIFFEKRQDSKLTDQLFETLRKQPNVLITCHQAFLTKEALQEIAKTTINNLVEWSENSNSNNEVTF